MIYAGAPYAAVEYGGIIPYPLFGVVLKGTSAAGVMNDLTTYALQDSLELQRALTKQASTLRFDMYGLSGRPIPSIGDQIDLYEGNAHIFGGTVTDISIIVEGGILLRYQISCTDWSFKINSMLVVESYSNEDPADIVRDIVSNFAGAGFTTYGVQTAGVNVDTIQFNYEQVAVAIEKLARQIGWEWYIDADKDIHFFPPSATADAPYDISDSSGALEWASLKIDQSIVNMKNSITVIGGTYNKTFDASSTPDVYKTDGTQSVFPLAYNYTPDTIVVTLAAVSQTIGTDQVTDPGSVQVLFNTDGRFIRFTSVPTTGQTVKIYGTAMIPILAKVQNQEAIAAFGEIEGSVIDQHISSIAEAQARGTAQIAEFGAPVYGVKFATLQTGFIVGQTVSVDSTIMGTDTLVEVKMITSRMYSSDSMRHEVECVGTEEVNFLDVMKLLLMQGNASTIINSSTVLQVLKLIDESVAVSDSLPAPTPSSPPYLWGAFNWGFGTWNA